MRGGLKCTVTGCTRKHHAKGYCRVHYASQAHDGFARQSAARAWQAAVDARRDLDDILDRMLRVEERVRNGRYLRRCYYCGEPALDVVCRQHQDLLELDNLAPSREHHA